MRKLLYSILTLIVLASCSDENEPIDGTPSVVQPIFPVNNLECANNDLTFIWNPAVSADGSSITYNLYLSEDPNLQTNVEVYQTTNTQYTVTNIPRGRYIYWGVEATNGTESSYSEIFSFFTQSVGINNIAPNIEYLSPQNNETISDQSPPLQWSANDEETEDENLSYRVYFSEEGQSLQLVYEDNDLSSYEVSGLDFGITYQWSIWVTDEDGATNIGQVQRFTVQ